MTLSASTTTTYSKAAILKDGDYDQFSEDSIRIGNAMSNVIENPWTRVVSLQTVVTVVVEPDPNLNEDFWLSVALGDWNG